MKTSPCVLQAPPNVVTSLEIAPFGLLTEVYPTSWTFNHLNLLNVSTSAVRSADVIRQNLSTSTMPLA